MDGYNRHRHNQWVRDWHRQLHCTIWSGGINYHWRHGVPSACTIHTFYDLCTLSGIGTPCNFCLGGTVPCDAVEATTANRAIITANCIVAYYACVTFTNASSSVYATPGTTSTAAPFSGVFTASRYGLFTTQQSVISCGCAYGYYSSANEAFGYDQGGFVTTSGGVPTDSVLHNVISASDGTAISIYVDGVFNATQSNITGTMVQPFYLGSLGGTSQFLQALFQGGGLTNTNITAGQAATLNQQQHTFIVGF